MKMGKLPARPEAISFSLASYVDLTVPTPPAHFWHPDPPPFGDYRNTEFGDCVFASFANMTRLWHHEGGYEIEFDSNGVLTDYSNVTGFDLKRADETDKGTDVADASYYWRHSGITAKTAKHRIDAYAKLALGDVAKLKTAMWLLGGVGIGFRSPKHTIEAFKRREPWDVRWSWRNLLGSDTVGGHFVPGIGFRPNGNIMCVSWGKIQEMTPRFYLQYADEVVCYLDCDRIDRVKRLSPEGFDERQLRHDLAALARGRVYARSPTGAV